MKYKTSVRTALGAALMGALLAPAAEAGRFANIQPAYVPGEKRATVRLEGSTDITGISGMNAYGFIDFDAPPNDTNLEKFFISARLTAPGYGPLKPVVKYEGGNGMRDVMRFGAAFVPSLPKGSGARIRVYPISTNGEKNPRIEVAVSQDIGPATASIFSYTNTNNGTTYLEPELDFKLGKKLTAFARGEGTEHLKDIQIRPSFGIKYEF